MDRLVNQSYQDWAHKIYEAAYGQRKGTLQMPMPSAVSAGAAGQIVPMSSAISGDESRANDDYEIHPTTIR